MATLRPFRQYDEHDVINMFAYDTSVAATALDTKGLAHVLAGKLVKVKGVTGWTNAEDDHWTTEVAGGLSYNNTLALRYNLKAQVEAADGGAVDEPILGVLLHDVREADENGELLKYNPRKADEMQVVIKGQAVPLVTKALLLIRDSALVFAPGGEVYVDTNGDFADATTKTANSRVVGRALGKNDANGDTLIRLEL